MSTVQLAIYITAGLVLVFLVGVLVGSGIQTKAQTQRDRRQADLQRALNAERYQYEYGTPPPWAGGPDERSRS